MEQLTLADLTSTVMFNQSQIDRYEQYIGKDAVEKLHKINKEFTLEIGRRLNKILPA